jgi:cytoskeletal protein CcmA (bactofilin family)
MKTSRNPMIWRGIAAILVLTIGFFVLVPPVYAAEINNKGVVAAGETINDDLMLSSDTVRMDGTVNGLLMAFGNDIIINGEVKGDLVAFGRSVTVTEKAIIDGNIFTAAQNVIINGKVTESLIGASMTLSNGPTSAIQRNQYFAGYSFTQSTGATTGKDIRAGVYQAILQGETGQDAVIYGEAVEVSGKINRNAEFIVGNSTNETETVPPFMQNMGVSRNLKPGLQVDPVAVIGGVMTYTSKVNQSNSISATPAGGIVFHTPIPSETETKQNETPTPATQAVSLFSGFAGFASNLISLFLIGALLLWKFPALLNENIDMVKAKPWQSTGYGFATIIIGYAGAFLLLFVIVLVSIIIGFLTIGGLGGVTAALGLSSLATVATLFNLAVSHVSKVIVAYLAGKWIFGKLAPAQTNAIWPMIIGVLVYAILRAIPFVGILFGIAATLLGVGAMWLVYREKTNKVVEPVTE